MPRASVRRFCFQLYRHDVDVRIEQMWRVVGLNRSGVRLYNRISAAPPVTKFHAMVELLSYVNRRPWYSIRLLPGVRQELHRPPHLQRARCLNRGTFRSHGRRCARKPVFEYCLDFRGGAIRARTSRLDLYTPHPHASDYAEVRHSAERSRVR